MWQTKELTAAHNNELREMMSAQEMEMDELREQAASSREQELRELKAACPGAKNLIAFRKQCVGYFLAE